MKKWLGTIYGLLCVICIACSCSATAVALGTVGPNITTSPVTTDLNGKPGSTVSTVLQVQNNQSTPAKINIQLETFKAYGTTGQAQIYAAPANADFIKWVHFSQTSFTAQPNIWVPITMTIKLPSNANLGYYYAVIFKPATTSTSPNSQEVIKSGNAVLILLDANTGNAKPGLQLTSFTASKKLYEYLPANFNVTIHNNGNIFLPPSGDIFISHSSSFNSTIATIPINPASGNVLPGTDRAFNESWADGFPVFAPKTINNQKVVDAKGNIEQQLQWNFSQANKFRFGKYYAKLVLAYNNGSRDVPVVATLSFWVIPWKILSIVALVIILLMIGLYSIGHRITARTVRAVKTKRHGKISDQK